MLWFLLTLYTRAIKKIGDWTVDLSGATALACVLGLSGILVHSAFDFNLQIPANAALFYVLCTIGLRTLRAARPQGGGGGKQTA